MERTGHCRMGILLWAAFCLGEPSAGAILEYSTLIGPREDNIPYAKYVAIGVDAFGCAYVSTTIPKTGFPTTSDARQKAVSQTAVTKLSADGGRLIYSSFFGGPSGTWIATDDMAVDGEGNAYLVGLTTGEHFPATAGTYHSQPIGPYPRKYRHDGFLVKFDPTLKNVIYGTYLGDNSWDEVMAVALDPKGYAYAAGDVAGHSERGRRVYKIAPDGTDAVYEHGVVGGYPYDIAVDAKGCAYIAGNCQAPYLGDFGTTPKAYRPHLVGKGDFVRKLDPSGKVVFSTFIRRIYRNLDADTAIAVDAEGCVYLARATEYPRERTTAGALDTTHNGAVDLYLFKLDPTGRHAIWATYLGGTDDERLGDVTVDDAGNVYVTGRTRSSDFPTTETALDKTNNGHFDVFVSVLDGSDGKLLYSTVVGGADYDTGQQLALDHHNGIYIAGTTRSSDFPTTAGAFQRTYSALGEGRYGGDVFVVKLNMTRLKTQRRGTVGAP